jgi:hypothetical protein
MSAFIGAGIALADISGMGEVELDGPRQHVSRSMNNSPVLRAEHVAGCGSPCSSCSAAPRSLTACLRVRACR